MKPYILIAEDEDALATLLEYNFQKEGYEVGVASDGDEVLVMAAERTPDLILMDWMMPKLSGVEACRRLRRKSETRTTPIIMLTARGDETDRITGLDYGADDYVVKPFSTPELLARVRAVLRRAQPGLLDDIIRHGDIEIDVKAFRVRRVFSREQLLDAVWGRDVYVEARTVDVHIGRLRKALKKAGGGDPIRTVRSAGYAFEVKS